MLFHHARSPIDTQTIHACFTKCGFLYVITILELFLLNNCEFGFSLFFFPNLAGTTRTLWQPGTHQIGQALFV